MAEQAEQMQAEIPAEIAEMSPLKVMLRAMWLEAGKGNWNGAATIAKDAAPYVHPRLSAETHKHSFDTEALTDDQIDAEIQRETARLGGGTSQASDQGQLH
jgi:hypothetical protein